ncbi:MAG: 4-(cytidine 5'-diphospho)-2-C-methyl-D-erythritol kinase [Actinobacteria bacterium]|nr:4-(cytidine 5'-diphospho)-2-C-methyl-D-erythritol kinase [Actinomycetota bacterium]
MTRIAPSSVLVRVPAKINLQLSVGPKEDDGYHGIVTVFQSISLYDDVKVSLAEAGSGIRVDIAGDHTHGVPIDDSNLSTRAAFLMCERYDLPTDLKIEIVKSIPVAGGLAGGSADAAATILALDSLFELALSRDEMHAIGAPIGSDVPFMLNGGTAVGRGRGDQITAALSRGSYHWVLALSSIGLSTPAVYGECDRLRAGMQVAEPHVNDKVLQALLAADPVALGKTLVNDLQPASCSLRPALRLILDVGDEYGALGSIVSGSGPTVAFLVSDEDHGLDLAVALTSSGVVGSVTRVNGPVSGAKVTEIY